MKNIIFKLILLGLSGTIMSCATIVGGSKYNAKVVVPGHHDAEIIYQGTYQGRGEAYFKVNRKDAHAFMVTIQKEGCETEKVHFKQRKFRGWALAGSILFWTGVVPGSGFPLPWGVALDVATGAYWKPDINEPGVSKQNFDHFRYQINYTGCEVKKEPEKEEPDTKSKADRLRELKELLDEGILTPEEFENEKKKILEE